MIVQEKTCSLLVETNKTKGTGLMNSLTDFITSLDNIDSLYDLENEVIKGMQRLFGVVVGTYLEALDDYIFNIKQDGYQVINKQPRTINFAFGEVGFKRRYYLYPDGKKGFLLDKKLKLEGKKRLSPYLRSVIASLSQTTTMRNTANVINLLTHNSISAWSVDLIAREIGAKAAEEIADNESKSDSDLRSVDNLVVEGDAVAVKSKDKGNIITFHHYRVYERQLHSFTNKYDIADLNRDVACERLLKYLSSHYDLKNCTIFFSSDAGPGFEPDTMLNLGTGAKKTEFVLDRYHALRKIKMTLGHFNDLTPKALSAFRHYDKDKLTVILDTYESQLIDDNQLNQLIRLRNYLDRNWEYITFPRDRSYKAVGNFGSIESSHRAFTYRLKKQGRSWSKDGLKGMLALIEARVNNCLGSVLRTSLRKLKELQIEPDESIQLPSVSAQKYLKKSFAPSVGVMHGRISVDAPTSSAIGRLMKIFR